MKRSFPLVEAAEASKKHAGPSVSQPDDAQPRLAIDPRDVDSSLDETKSSKTLPQSLSRVFNQPDQGENEVEVCYGSLLDLSVQIREDPLLYKGSSILRRNNGVIHISTSFVGSYCWINFRDAARFGCLSQKTSQALRSITALPSVEIEGITSWSSIDKASAEWNKLGNLATLRIDMNVYGSSAATVAKSAGRFLSNARLFLQSPSSITRSVVYDNPQYLRLTDVSSMHIIHKPTQHLAEQVPDSAKEVSHLELESILNSIPQPKVLREVPITSQIRTALKSYQREGVDFLTSRETGDLPPSLSLWKPHSPPGGPFCYKHVITGAKSSEMNDVLGGILADEMGLGKTLTVLAVIAGSLGRALDYAVRRTSGTTNSWKDVAPCKTTLVIVPSSLLLDSWEEEIAKHLEPGTLATHRYHGSGKCVDITHLLRMDVVLTTYATVAADFFRGKSTLNRIEWYRLVLDEAHYIRNSSCKQFRVIQSIPARIRWCLTGTPIQNSLEDLGALLKFLRIPVLDDSASFRNHICTPILSTKMNNRFSNLVRLLEAICLRRTKALLKQPEPLVEINRLHFTNEEHNKYSDYALNCKHDIDMAVSGHSFKKANQHVIQAILGLRLFCNDGERFLAKRTSPNGLPSLPEDALSVLQTSSNAFCIQCGCEITTMYQRDDKSSGVLTICQHLVCGECLPIFEADLNDKTEDGRSCCPSCGRTAERTSFIITPSSDEEQSTDPQAMTSWPTKLHAVLKNVQSQNPNDKCVIFSFWKTTLDIMAKMFDANSLPYLRIHGSIPANQRARILSDFENSPSTRVLLITLGTGAVGLNKMKSANIVHIIEPQWNPSVENQAIGRVVRLGQEKAVKIFRYIMQGSVEEAVQSRQLRKLQLARGGFGLSKDDHGEKRISEIMSLICPSFLGKQTR